MAVVKRTLLSHWKFKSFALRLAEVLPDVDPYLRTSAALTLLASLWVYCETQRAFKWKNMTAQKLAAVCNWPKNPDWLLKTLIECQFVDEKNGVLTVHDWQIHNAALVRCWKNAKYGALGGRPHETRTVTRKGSTRNPQASPRKPQLDRIGSLNSTPLPPKGDEFERFWELYPRKVGKRAAQIKWKALRPDLATCLAALREQMASAQWQREGGRFVPHPATWLGQGRWDDKAGEFENFGKNQAPPDGALEAEVPGWRELLEEANPELNLPRFWGELPPWGRSYALELYNAKQPA